MENNFENAKTFIKDRMPKHLYGGDARQLEIARCMIDYANVVLPQADVIKSVCLHEWDEGHQNVSKCKKCGKYSV